MFYPDIHKKWLLFISLENPLFARILRLSGIPRRVQTGHVDRILGLPAQTLSNWRNGRRIDYDRAEETLSAPLKYIDKHIPAAKPEEVEEIGKFLEQFRMVVVEGTMNLSEVARFLGLKPTACQRIFDQAIYGQWPLFPRMYYSDENESNLHASHHLHSFGGIYIGWGHRNFSRVECDAVWFQFSMHIPYLVPVGAGHALACKLTIPYISPGMVRDEKRKGRVTTPSRCAVSLYDGFLAARPYSLNFVSEEQLHLPEGAYFHFMTCNGREIDGHMTYSGQYLTTEDLSFGGKVATGDLLLQRIYTLDDDHDSEECRKLIETSPDVILNEDPRTEFIRKLRQHFVSPKRSW
jgi:hypothetical protein